MDALMKFIEKHERIYLYGAGANGALLADALLDKNAKISGVVVTRRKPGQVRFLEFPVLELNELDAAHSSCCGFIFALGSKFHCEVESALSVAGFRNFFRIPDVFFQELWETAQGLSVQEIISAWPQPDTNYLRPTSWRRILIFRLDGIGDVVLFTPFLRALRQAHPKSEITLVVQPMVYNLVEACPYIDHLLIYDWHEDSEWPLRARCRHAWRYVQDMGMIGRYDIVLNPRWDVDYYDAGALAYFTGTPCCVAWSEHVLPRKEKLNCGFDGFYTMTLQDKRICHEVEHNMQFLAQLGVSILGESL